MNSASLICGERLNTPSKVSSLLIMNVTCLLKKSSSIDARVQPSLGANFDEPHSCAQSAVRRGRPNPVPVERESRRKPNLRMVDDDIR
jgi:hypothetical protein